MYWKLGYTLILVLLAIPASLTGQTSPATPNKSSKPAKWALRRTPDGQPDLQGVWTNATRVPLERPVELGSKEFYTKEEAAEEAKLGLRGDRPKSYSVVQYDLTQYGLETGQQPLAPSLRTSLIVGPTGRIPPMTADGKRRAAERAAFTEKHAFDGPETRSLSERCILWPNEGPPMLPGGYNSNLEIVQGPGYVAIMNETIHDTRLIPLDGRPHVPENIRQLRGDSRGHWEGDTLVIDTTNFTDRTAFRGASDKLHVVERLTRTADNIIIYRFTIDDPSTWIQPWSGEVMMVAISSPIYEYACQEGNYGMADILAGARAQERAEAAGKK
jgi:hypothetical protein